METVGIEPTIFQFKIFINWFLQLTDWATEAWWLPPNQWIALVAQDSQ